MKYLFFIIVLVLFSCKKEKDFTCSGYQSQIIEKMNQNTLLQKRVDSLQNELKKADLYIDMLEHPIITNEN